MGSICPRPAGHFPVVAGRQGQILEHLRIRSTSWSRSCAFCFSLTAPGLYDVWVVFSRTYDNQQKQLRYTLVVCFSDGSSHSVPVGESAITIGRSPATAIRLNEDGVSRQHCVITPSGGRLMLLDQGSTNGTYVNGAQVQQTRLSHGDVIQVGSTRIRVQARTVIDLVGGIRSTPTKPSPAVSRSPIVTAQGAFTLLGRLSSRLARSIGAASAAELVLDTLLEAIPVDRAYVLTERTTRQESMVDILAAKSREPDGKVTSGLDLEIPARVMAALKADPHLITAAEATAAVAGALRTRSSRPMLCTPLHLGTKVIGALYLDALTLPEWAHSNEMLSLLTAIGDLASLALTRAQLRAEHQVDQRLSERERRTRSSHPSGAAAPAAESDAAIEDQKVELMARVEELRYLRNSQATIARGLAHDVRSLIGALENNLESVARALPPSSSKEEAALREASLCGESVIALTEDIATLSRLEDGTFSLHTEKTDLSQIIDEALGRHTQRARDRGINLRFTTFRESSSALVDAALIGRILDHLIDNSLRHAGRGGRITISTRRRSTSVEIIVADTGPGVPPEQRQKVFSQGETPTLGTRHHGVGLYFCRLAAEAHGGSTRFEGTESNNRFVVSLPVVIKLPPGIPNTDEYDTFEDSIESDEPEG